jgi:hypothetical protein
LNIVLLLHEYLEWGRCKEGYKRNKSALGPWRNNVLLTLENAAARGRRGIFSSICIAVATATNYLTRFTPHVRFWWSLYDVA